MKWVSGLVFMVVMLFSNIAAAENCQGEKLNIFIQGLDKTKVESVLKFSEEIKAYSKGKEFACVEPFIVYFVSFYQESLYEFSKANGIWDSSYPMPSKKKDELVSRIKQVGWDLMESEGAYYIAEQGDWISKEFEPILNQPWKDYFALETVEIKESFLSEEGDRMAISWESLCDRIIHWDGFMAKYPEFPLIGSIQSLGSIRYNHAEYVEALLIGKDLTIVGDKEDGQLLPEVKKEYERFIKVNTKSKFHPLFKEYYDLLSKNNFMLDEKALGFLTQERVRSLFEEDKPPTR